MLAYHSSLSEFKKDVLNNMVLKKMLENINVGQSELRSWSPTILYMYSILSSLEIDDDVEIGMELKIPLGRSRIDFLISGLDENNKNKLIIIELKQWSNVQTSNKENLVFVPNYLNEEFLHPSYQAYTYQLNLEAYNEAVVSHEINIKSSSCLFNLIDDQGIKDPIYADIIDKSPIFSQSDNEKLKEFIKSHIKKGSKYKNLLYLIHSGEIKPSQMLIETLESSLKDNKHFLLLDKQQVAFANIMNILEVNDNKKHVTICKGGAGTGKSVIAIRILAELIKKQKNTFYLTKNSAVRRCYERYLRGKANEHLRTLFMSAIHISKERPVDEYHCLLVDEAHRLPERSKAGFVLLGTDLIDEIIKAAKFSVFFIDEKQQVDIRDYATIDKIIETAKKNNAIVHNHSNLELEAQFRCAGNDDYIHWVESILYNEEKTFQKSREPFNFDVKVFSDFTKFYNEFSKKIELSNKNRFISGDVFPWITKDNDNLFDIVIDGIELKWNKDANYVVDENQKYRVGHIDTVQGMEFEYCGLIIGDDLLYRDGKVVTDYKKHPIRAGHFRRHGRTTVIDDDLKTIDQIIRNTYNVLLTRPTKGIYIYCMDEALKKHIKDRLKALIKANRSN